ncbi:MAG: response regulator [Arthrospira sp. SH-MAG29]|nr:response regulator [Arthrospira sp. SH-MAG29]MBS0016580.1 response regulator [Arthrospira sp. SH-MAG29]
MDDLAVNQNKGDILIVDDKPENLQFLFTMLTENGYDVRRVINGKQAINVALFEPPDLILLDIMMPNLNGYDVCKILKEKPETKDIPIIFLSALKDVSEKVKGFNVGGVDYISKPFELLEILARVENQLTIVRQKRQLAEQNARLEQLNQQLLRSNQELEQFASVVSHDLQQPLTSLKAFAQLLQIECYDELKEKPREYVNHIINASIRMQRMIQDLLIYCGCDTHSPALELINCNQVLAQILVDLRLEINKNHAQIKYDNLPEIKANHIHLTEVFQNLISNAIKYRSDDLAPLINISCQETDTNWIFCCADNGIGIESQEFENIFKIFTRLHTFKKYPGTGIGLSICKKIIESYGGKIWLESNPGLGTQFYFTFPKFK